MMTWWVTPKMGGGTTFDFGTGNLGATKHIYSGDITINEWHQVASHIHWSTVFQQGHIIVWLDGRKIVDEAAQTRADQNPLFFQAGIQRATRSTASDAILFDNFLEGTTLDDIGVSAPADAGAADGAAPADGSVDGGAGGALGTGGAGGGSGGATTGSGGDGSGSSTVATGGSGGASTSATTTSGAGGDSSGGATGSSKPLASDASGCSCTVPGSRPNTGASFLVAALALMGVIRRRKASDRLS
jgi:MYXO-CTERM domain-containing protein